MYFTLSHELNAPLKAIELALLSPGLGPLLANKVPSLDSVVDVKHHLESGQLHRVLRFQAKAPLAIFKGYDIAKDAMSWEEHWTYTLSDHTSTWVVYPKDEWRRYFRSQGTYVLSPVHGTNTLRRVEGTIDIKLPLLGRIVEKMAVAEVKKTYDAEAEALGELMRRNGQ